jgi:ribonuclease HI
VAAGVTATTRLEKYLGLPALIGRSRISSFSSIKGRIWECLNGWKEKFLSQAGKEVLLKAVVQAIPTYTMSVFQLPKTLCTEINSMMSKFWWGHKGNDKRIAWMSWSKMGRGKSSGGLGFRDLEMFNLALLAKQGWRLLQNPDTLVAKIFRKKYYPNGSLLESNLGWKPSYVWQSIRNSIPILKEGLVWRVGDGASIRIWEDRWLPTPGSHLVQSPVRLLPSDAKVCDLLDPDTNWWNFSMVHHVFRAEEAQVICSMAVCPRNRKDQLVWAGTKHGDYTVRSAYHMMKENGIHEGGSCSNAQDMAAIWKGIWKINCARVVKTFLWQACTNILPTKELLFKRHITADPLCPICGLAIETIGHILWACPSAKDVWLECNPTIHKCTSDEVDFIYIMEKLMERVESDQMHLIVTVARQIWLRRNAMVFGGAMVAPSVLVRRAQEQVEAVNDAAVKPYRAVVASHPTPGWLPPPLGHVKINWDASISKQQNRMGVGISVRDHTGKVVVMACATKDFINNPTMAEAVGAWFAVALAKRLGLRNVLIEGDALEVVDAINKEGNCWTVYGQIVNDIKEDLGIWQGWNFQHVSRRDNGVAHRLAHLAFMHGAGREWRADFPFHVDEVVI